MIKVLTLASLTTLLALVGLSAFASASHRTPVEHIDLTLPSQFVIGMRLPPELFCSTDYPVTTNGERFCMYNRNVLIVETGQAVARAYVFVPRDKTAPTIGALINELGTPIGARYSETNVYLYWSDRWSAIRAEPQISPASKVLFVTYGSPPSTHVIGRWRGFVAMQRP